MPPAQLQPALEALLFSSDQPLPLTLLCESLDAPAERVLEAMRALEEEYAARGAGVQVREIAGGYLLVTAPEHAEWVGRLLRGRKKMRLSRAALETMAIIAYKQPVTKSEVEAIRGVDSSAVLGTLLERNLVTIRGRSKVVGRPLLYGTTQEFLDYFGLKDLSEMPRPEELRALVAAREPEQMEMMELEEMAQVAAEIPTSTAAPHEILPLDASAEADDDDDDEEYEGDEAYEDDGDDEDEDEDDDDGEDEEDDDEDADAESEQTASTTPRSSPRRVH